MNYDNNDWTGANFARIENPADLETADYAQWTNRTAAGEPPYQDE
jgi:hypothetical protein